MDKIIVSGIGAICAAGKNTEEILQNLYNANSTPAPATSFSVDYRSESPVFEVTGIRTDADCLHSRTLYLLRSALEEALNNAGLGDGFPEGLRVGFCLGSTTYSSTEPTNEERCRHYLLPDMSKNPGPLEIDALDWIRGKLDISGPCTVVMNACASGTDAVGTAMEWLRHGLCDIVIAAGADELSRISFLGFNSLQVYSSAPCRPFSGDRTGLNLGEGAGVLILEKEDSAAKRGIRPLATADGYGTACDGFHLTAPHDDARGLKQAAVEALNSAGLEAADIDFVNAHGTATPTNDRVEGRAIAALFGPEVLFCATKTFTGHTLGAAGALEAVITVGNLRDGRIPGTGFTSVPDADIPVRPVEHTTAGAFKKAASFSLAFGGINSVLIFGGVR